MQEQQQQIEKLIKQNDASQQIMNELRKRLDDLEKKLTSCGPANCLK